MHRTGTQRQRQIDRFERVISIDGGVSEELRGKIAEIADSARSTARSRQWRRSGRP